LKNITSYQNYQILITKYLRYNMALHFAVAQVKVTFVDAFKIT